MIARRHLIAPAYLLLCLLLGGASNAGFGANLALQLLALPILVWAAASTRADGADAGRTPLLLALATALLLCVQVIPLPPAVWSSLPGMGPVADGYRLLGMPLPWRPLSLTPESTMAALVWLLPTFAMLAGMIRLGAFRSGWIAGAIVAAMAGNVVIGALQMLGGSDSSLYFYAITNVGNAVGLFANSNHTATLLVVAIPFVAALQAANAERRGNLRQKSAVTVIAIAALMVIGVGLVINTSLAGIGLAIPVAAASFTLLRATPGRRTAIIVGGVALLTLAAAIVAVVGPFDSNLVQRDEQPVDLRQLTRSATIGTTVRAAATHLPLGSGAGSFRQVYRGFENPAEVGATYINHAHSDVAEVALELGLAGIALMIALFAWWLRRLVALWRDPRPSYFARAGAIAAGAIMAHSLVDYPLRTAAIGAVFAACLALTAGARAYVRPARGGRQARHLGV